MEYANNSTSAFSAAYMTRDHPGMEPTMNLNYPGVCNPRSMTEYLRVDSNPTGFNPLIDSLNFVSNPMNYENSSNNSSSASQFTGWPSQIFTTDGRNGLPGGGGKQSRSPYFRANSQATQDRLLQFPADDYRSMANTSISNESLYCPVNKLVSASQCQPGVHHTTDVNHLMGGNTVSTKTSLGLTGHLMDTVDYLGGNGIHKTNGTTDLYDYKLEFNSLVNCSGPGGMTLTNKNVGGTSRRNSAPVTVVKPDPLGSISISDPKTMATSPGVFCGLTSLQKTTAITSDSSSASVVNKFSLSSDESEVSPTPTAASSQTCPPGRSRKIAPTLATGRRNLKHEPVDPDEADRRMKRRERNRKSAQKCRERKVQRTHELQAQVDGLEKTANRLIQERDNFRNQALQYVSLLQQHCPGIAIPYLSCLNDAPDDLACMRINCNEITRSVNEKSMIATAGWKQRLEGETVIDGLTGNISAQMNHEDPLSPLPTMVSLHNHHQHQHHHHQQQQQQQQQQQHQHPSAQHPSQSQRLSHTMTLTPSETSRNKSIFSFSSDAPEATAEAESDSGYTSLIASSGLHSGGGGCESKLMPVGDRCSNLRGQASASSSSPSSNYEMSYPAQVDPAGGQTVSTHMGSTTRSSFGTGDPHQDAAVVSHQTDATTISSSSCDTVIPLRTAVTDSLHPLDFKHCPSLVEGGSGNSSVAKMCDSTEAWSPAVNCSNLLSAGQQHRACTKLTGYQVNLVTVADSRHETNRVLEANRNVGHLQEACFS